MSSRVEFGDKVKKAVAGRAGYLCSNPDCGCATSGPNTEPLGVTRIGEAAHICAASEEGPRYDADMTDDERSEIDNAIWLCSNCHTMIDRDAGRYPVALLRAWKAQAELMAQSRLGKPTAHTSLPAHAASPLVASYNQSGGQTALIINNNERPPRTIRHATIPRDMLRRMRARKVEGLVIVSYASDSDTLGLAMEFAQFAAWIGWCDEVPEPARVIGGETWFIGVHVRSVGTDTEDPLRVFAEWLKRIGVDVAFESGAQRNYINVSLRG